MGGLGRSFSYGTLYFQVSIYESMEKKGVFGATVRFFLLLLLLSPRRGTRPRRARPRGVGGRRRVGEFNHGPAAGGTTGLPLRRAPGAAASRASNGGGEEPREPAGPRQVLTPRPTTGSQPLRAAGRLGRGRRPR